ncbi:hypothetical protein [Kaistia algarum]|uniref:hypothetical protein n=1 Tax=Kaistia algarum TaxID=2083279 RepID=UPI001A9C9330|nr:hypothetical protein [Kaistia algarum]MCX5512252.1 hypothetical protein [Kaistia algarum]
MVAYSFKARFIPKIEDGSKRHTIRADRARHARAGEPVQLYEGMRTRTCRLIGAPQCLLVGPIRIFVHLDRIECGPWTYRTAGELDLFAERDGFEDWADMCDFWMDEHPSTAVFSGQIIFWDHEYFAQPGVSTGGDGDLFRLIDVVTTGLVTLPSWGPGDYEGLRAYHRAGNAILDQLAHSEGAKISRRGDAWTLAMAGVRASSTGGAATLLRNWRAGAQKRFAGGAA